MTSNCETSSLKEELIEDIEAAVYRAFDDTDCMQVVDANQVINTIMSDIINLIEQKLPYD